MLEKTFLVVGGDKRSALLHKSLLYKNINSKHIFYDILIDKENGLKELTATDVLILPTPLTADNEHIFAPKYNEKILLSEILAHTNKGQVIFGGGNFKNLPQNLKYYNLLEDETMTLKNAMATAEGAISIIIKETESTVFNSKIIIFGFGRIAKLLSRYLRCLGADVSVVARKREVRTRAELSGLKTTDFNSIKKHLESADIIINTVPAKVLGENELPLIKADCFLLDLASKPGGIDFEFAKKINLKYNHALSLPGLYSPLSSAKFIEESILHTLHSLKGENYER